MIPPLLFFFYMLYGIPCFILYLIVFILLVRTENRKRYFNSSFFKLAMLIGFIVSTISFQLRELLFLGFNVLCDFHYVLQSSSDPVIWTHVRRDGELFLLTIYVLLQLLCTVYKDWIDYVDSS